MTHTLFNLAGILLIYPWLRVRFIPVDLAERLASVALERPSLALGYTLGTFVILPIAGILIF